MRNTYVASCKEQVLDIHGIEATIWDGRHRNSNCCVKRAFLSGIDSLGVMQIDRPARIGYSILKATSRSGVVLCHDIVADKSA